MVGALLESPGDWATLRAADAGQLHTVANRPMPPLESLVVLAMTSRKEPRRIRSEIAALQNQLHGSSPLTPTSVSISYRNLKATDAGALSRNQNFLQGHSILPEAVWDFSKRSRSEQDTRKEILALRAQALEIELAATEREIRFALQKTHVLTAAHREKLELAQKRLELSMKAETLVKTRFDHGFGGPDVVFQAESSSTRAQAEVARVQHELTAGVVTLFTLCGGEPESLPQLPRTFEVAAVGGGN
jgi:outer membrane protein TolC